MVDNPDAGYVITDLEHLDAGVHLFVVPLSLVDQWGQEARRLLIPGAFEVVPYVGASNAQNRANFCATFEALHGSRRMVIASHAVRALT